MHLSMETIMHQIEGTLHAQHAMRIVHPMTSECYAGAAHPQHTSNVGPSSPAQRISSSKHSPGALQKGSRQRLQCCLCTRNTSGISLWECSYPVENGEYTLISAKQKNHESIPSRLPRGDLRTLPRAQNPGSLRGCSFRATQRGSGSTPS